MNNFYKMTKEQLVATCRKLYSENETLKDELDRLSDCYTEMENKLVDATHVVEQEAAINDVEHFKYRLRLDGLLTPELEEFIEYYMRYHNDERGE